MVESEAGNLTTPGPIDLQATLAALVDRGAAAASRWRFVTVSTRDVSMASCSRAAVLRILTRDHLDYHETFEAYFAAKAKLVGYLADAGLVIVNADDAAWTSCRVRRAHHVRGSGGGRGTGREWQDARRHAREVHVDGQGARFQLVTPEGTHPVALPLLGRFNVANALGVAACAVGLGVPAPIVAERLSSAPQVPGRMERIALDPCVVLRDYAHTPDALERALETVREVTAPGGRVIVVFGAGGDRDRGKRAPMGEIATRPRGRGHQRLPTIPPEDPERILDDVEAGMGGRHYRIVDRRAASARRSTWRAWRHHSPRGQRTRDLSDHRDDETAVR
jgi:UDP-N-acetylmuramyl tripeptide synthase